VVILKSRLLSISISILNSGSLLIHTALYFRLKSTSAFRLKSWVKG